MTNVVTCDGLMNSWLTAVKLMDDAQKEELRKVLGVQDIPDDIPTTDDISIVTRGVVREEDGTLFMVIEQDGIAVAPVKIDLTPVVNFITAKLGG